METGQKLDLSPLSSQPSVEHPVGGLPNTPVKRMPALVGTNTDVPHVPRLSETSTSKQTTSSLSWTPFAGLNHGMFTSNGSLSKSMDTKQFAKPAIPSKQAKRGN